MHDNASRAARPAPQGRRPKRTAKAAPEPEPLRDPDEKLTLAEVCAELKIARSTFYEWRAKGRAPKCSTLPNGELRIVRRDLDEWFSSCKVA